MPFLQGIFLTQGLNLDFCIAGILYHLSLLISGEASRPFSYCMYLFVHAIFSSFLGTFLVYMQVVGSYFTIEP